MSDNSNRSPERFTINVAQDVLDDLTARLKSTRFFDDLDNEEEYYGLSTDYLKPLVEYWADGFDWRAAEKRLNGMSELLFTDQTVVITGAARGLGLAHARLFAERGARIILITREPS